MNVIIAKKVTFASAMVSLAISLALPASVGATARRHLSQEGKSNHKVTICHRTNSVTNRYRQITISYSAYDGNEDNDHTHHGGSWAYSEEYARELKKNHIKWGDIVPADKCEKPVKKDHKKHDKKERDHKPEQPEELESEHPDTSEQPEEPEQEESKPQVLATSTTKTPPATPQAKDLANTGVSTAISTLAALGIISATGVTTYLSRRKLVA